MAAISKSRSTAPKPAGRPVTRLTREQAQVKFAEAAGKAFPSGQPALDVSAPVLKILREARQPMKAEAVWREMTLSGVKCNYALFREKLRGHPLILSHNAVLGLAEWYQ